jgi:drug/metabolite transporter (DMT)-like permease
VHTETNPIKGILFCFLSYFFISLIGVFEKSISHGVSIPVILFFQNSTCFCLILIELSRNKIKLLKPQQLSTYLIRIGSGMGCYVTLFYIIRYIPVSEAMLYQYSASLWIPFIMLFWLKVKMPAKLWTGILIGFTGMILILKPGQSMLGLVSLVGILCSVFQGISVVAIRKLSTEPIARVLFYYYLIAILCTSLFAIRYWTPLSVKDFVSLLGVGFATYSGQKIFAYSCRFAHPTTLAPICYTSILYSGLLGWIFWSEIPDDETILGMAFVILGCILTVFMNRSLSKHPVSLAFEKS